MKKSLLIAVTCLLTGISGAYAQLSYGIKAGLNIASLNASGDDGDVSSQAGFYGGAFVNFSVAEKFSIQPELLYSMQGAKLGEGEVEGVTVSAKQKLDYLNLPVMAQYQVADGLYLEAGPQLGFLLSAETTVEGNGVKNTVDSKDAFKSIDFGLGFGAGYKLPIGLGINARYNLGLANIIDENEGDGSLKNSVFQIGLSYSF